MCYTLNNDKEVDMKETHITIRTTKEKKEKLKKLGQKNGFKTISALVNWLLTQFERKNK